jgi:hypothetical protein
MRETRPSGLMREEAVAVLPLLYSTGQETSARSCGEHDTRHDTGISLGPHGLEARATLGVEPSAALSHFADPAAGNPSNETTRQNRMSQDCIDAIAFYCSEVIMPVDDTAVGEMLAVMPEQIWPFETAP